MTVLSAGARLGPYEIVGLVGTGGMGEVYRARDTRLGREVALKVLLPSSESSHALGQEQLVREARLISTLNHPHIRAIYEASDYDGVTVIVMEYVEGETLDHRLSRRALPVPQALTYAEQLAGALDAAHSLGIIHHDVKPANVMITSHGVKLLDFGIATLQRTTTARDVVEATTITDTGNVPGTIAYMAPEQLDGSTEEPRSDIFALGIVMYEMLTGRKPFEGPTRARMIASILEHQPAPLSSVARPIPPAVERTVMKCLAKDPCERWQTARDLASELAWISRDLTPTVSTRPAARGDRRSALMFALIAGVVVASLIAYGASRTERSSPLPAPVRFLATAPANSVITVAAGAFAISPDGRQLAFTASPRGGPPLLWIRSLDSFEAHALSGTDDASFPFWAPDSRTVAFFAGNQLKTVDITGSPLQIVTQVPPNSQWGSWGRAGDIIITNAVGLFRVRASGGAVQTILSREQQPDLLCGAPEFLPDGTHFLLGVVEPDKPRDQVSMYAGTLENPMESLLVRADSQVIYSEPGYLLYTRAGSLIAHPFDATSRQLAGEPLSLPDPVAFVRPQRRASFSVSQNNVLAYRQGVSMSQLTWFDRSGRRLGVVGTPGRYVNPSIAPDGTRIAVTRLAPSITESNIWLFEPRGERPLTPSPGMEDYAVWSPDGGRIVYASSDGGFMELYAKDTAASAEEPGVLILKNGQQKMPMDWAPDGQRVVFLDSAGAVLPRLPFVYAMASRDHVAEPLAANAPASSSREDQVQISPDGRWMAYVSDASGSAQVYVRQFPMGQRRWQVSTEGGFEPKWRGDGRELFYIDSDQQIMSVNVSVRVGSFEAGRPTPLFRTTVLGAPFQNGFVRNEYSVTRDGQRFLINEPIGGSAAYAIRVLVNWRSLLPPTSP